ncbi:MAG: hypothetical protein ACTSRA_15340 [Promethearchaeota archaeon]
MSPIINGKYVLEISTIYATPNEAIEEIKKRLKTSRKIRINNIPMFLLEELKPLLKDKDLKIILPEKMEPNDELKTLGDVATTKAKIYVNYKGKEAASGMIAFSDKVFNVYWIDDNILEITAMNYSKCVKCMQKQTFDSAWRFSRKW